MIRPPTTVIFVCPGFAACYAAEQRIQQVRCLGDFACWDCGAKVHTWSRRFDFVNWTRFEGNRT
jgi:hypothetical protein